MTREAELAALVKELADELEAEINTRYAGLRHYPSMLRDCTRDMELVLRARAALAKTEEK